ncbi:MAG: hypothetical protein RMJ07_05055 [Nitrososphaerota archaeon]|nr:hypothetical protein [Candidatus Bathyarchaeota archaeon]MDW8049034.1 hypothetical protein [Nitrososphaerota archaeon]
MPQQIICHKCGHVLYYGGELKSPEEIHQMYEGKCPKCGRDLSSSPINVDVKPANNSAASKFIKSEV